MGGYIIAGIVGLLMATLVFVVVFSSWRRRRQRRAQVRSLLAAFVTFNAGWRLEDDRPQGWPAAIGRMGEYRILIEGFGEDPNLALRIQLGVQVAPFLWLRLTPRENLQVDPLAYEPAFRQLFVVKERPDGWFEQVLEQEALLPFKIEGALEPLFAEQGLLESFLEIDGEGRLMTLQHVKMKLTVNELQTAVNLLTTLAGVVERFDFEGD